MIVFDLSCLSDDSHRRHLIDAPEDNCITCCRTLRYEKENTICTSCKIDPWNWKQDFPAYYEACDGDDIFIPVRSILIQYCHRKIQIWSSNPESVRKKIECWIENNILDNEIERFKNIELKLRPIGDDRPQEELFEHWRHQFILSDPGKNIDMVFSSHEPTIAMFRARGVFVFDCNQGK